MRSGTPGRFFEGGNPVDLDDLMSRPVVFEIEDLGDDRDKAFFLGTLIIRLVELLRLKQKHGQMTAGLSHVLVIEEAHRLLRKVADDSPSAHAVTMFANMLAEIRAYGEGVVVAEQIPSKVISDVVKNSAIKLMHRLPGEDDRSVVGATMNLDDEQSRHVVALPPGVAVAHTAGMDRPLLVRIDRARSSPRTGTGRSSPRLGSRSSACPTDCVQHRCSLGELETARDLGGAATALWAEQAVVAHLTWDRIGCPRGEWIDRLRNADRRRARCSIALAVESAVGRRLALVRQWHNPAELESSIAELLAAQLSRDTEVDRPAFKWTVGQFRLAAVRQELLAEEAATSSKTTHPRTALWLAAGVDLPGPSRADQLVQLEVMTRATPPVRQAQLAGSPTVLEELARALGYDTGSEQRRIARAVRSLGLEHRWLVHRVGARDD